MADERITALAALGAAPAAGDLIEIVDVSDTSMAAGGTNKKMTVTELFSGIPVDVLPASDQKLGSATLPWLETFTGSTTQYESVVSTAGLVTHAALGSATNIGISLTPKGTGTVNSSTKIMGPRLGNGLATYSFTGGTSGYGSDSGNTLLLIVTGSNVLAVAPGLAQLGSSGRLTWGSNADANLAGADTGLSRVVAGVAAIGTGAAASRAGWMQWAGQAYLAGDGTNATATLATTGLSVNVTTGRKYGFKCILYVSDSVAAEGVQIDFAGGSATETNFRAQATGFDTALAVSTQLDDLADVASAATFTGNGMIEINGTFEPSSTGTFIPRFAQASHVTGTLTIFRGSHLLMWDMP